MSHREGEQFGKKWVRVEAMALVRALTLVAELGKKFADIADAWLTSSFFSGEAGKAPAQDCFGEPIYDGKGLQVGIRRPDPNEVGIDGIDEFRMGLDKIDHEDSWAESVDPRSNSCNVPTRIDYVDSEGYKDWEIVRTYKFDFNDRHNLPILYITISLGKKEKGAEWERAFESVLKCYKYPKYDGDTVLKGRAISGGDEFLLHSWKAEKKALATAS